MDIWSAIIWSQKSGMISRLIIGYDRKHSENMAI